MESRVCLSSDSLAGWWFLTCQQQLLCIPQGVRIPFGHFDDMVVSSTWLSQAEYFTDYLGEPCYRLELESPIDLGVGEWIPLYNLLSELKEPFFQLASQAMQQGLFLKTHRFCGQCGRVMERVDWELAMQCPECGFRAYPRISPSIIVAIRKGQDILLACHKRHARSHRYVFTAIAGFAEAGETLEQCVRREVHEEVGLTVTNLRYAGSQSWPFPHSMMVAFWADYVDGELIIQHSELHEANWFSIDALPQLPAHGTIARRIIDELAEQIRSDLSV